MSKEEAGAVEDADHSRKSKRSHKKSSKHHNRVHPEDKDVVEDEEADGHKDEEPAEGGHRRDRSRSILKTTKTGSPSKSDKKKPHQLKRGLSFADDHGGNLETVHHVKNTHYRIAEDSETEATGCSCSIQ